MARKSVAPDVLEKKVKEVDDLILDFERKAKKQEQNKASMVKRNAAEKDLLKAAEKLRDKLMEEVKGDKNVLAAVFGGDCSRFWRIKNIMDGTELLPNNEKDARWKGLREAMNIIEEVLKTLGQFKMWQGPTPPETLEYKDVQKHRKSPSTYEPEALPTRLSPGQNYIFEALTTGCVTETLLFSVQPRLPPNLLLDPHSGEISGLIPHGFKCQTSTWTVKAENKAGAKEVTLTFAVQDVAPADLSYGQTDKSANVGDNISWRPSSTEGKPESYEISPPLPLGLTLDTSSGVISGSPTKMAEKLEYTVTAKNDSGECKTTFSMEVQDAPPTKILYPEMHQTDLTLGQNCYFIPDVILGNPSSSTSRRVTMAMINPNGGPPGGAGGGGGTWGRSFASSGMNVGTKWGKVKNAQFEQMMLKGCLPDLVFEATPALPKGLHLATNTGIITGRPIEGQKKVPYKITCSNGSGKCSLDIALGVVQKPPMRLNYPEANDNLQVGKPLTFHPEVENLPTDWSVEPELPAGLKLDEEMGKISGIPEETCERQVFTITASNEAGSAKTQLTLTIQRTIPTSFSYPGAALEYPVRCPLELLPVLEGLVDKFSIDKPLPPGLEFDTQTGRIFGTPTDPSPTEVYHLEAKNESGSAKTALIFEIKEMPPSGLCYPRLDDMYQVGEVVDCMPELAEGGATVWSIEPDLPEGMTFDTSTGAIFGTPLKENEDSEYTVTASNEAGGTSAVIEFLVVGAPTEQGFAYPNHGNFYVGFPVELEPEAQGFAIDNNVSFSVAPDLPRGFTLDARTGALAGAATEESARATYKVTATFASGGTITIDLPLCVENGMTGVGRASVKKAEVHAADLDWAATIEEVTDISQLPPAPPREQKENWMVWMVHRAWLNDASLDVLDFTNLQMPLPHEEPRIAPKLMKALSCNTNLKSLLLADTNLRAPQAHHLSEALTQNKTLTQVNIESNWLDPEALRALAKNVGNEKCNSGSLTTLRFANQIGLEKVGRPIEQAVAEMMQANKLITRLGFSCEDPHWNNVISNCLTRNSDLARRKRKGLGDGSTETSQKTAAVERTLDRVELSVPPDQAIWEIVEDDDKHIRVLRQYLSTKCVMPNPKQLQSFAAGAGVSIAYGKVGPLLKDFSQKLLDAFKGRTITLSNSKDGRNEGQLISWSEKNQRWCFEVKEENVGFFKYVSDKQIDLSLSEEVAAWLEPEAETEAEE